MARTLTDLLTAAHVRQAGLLETSPRPALDLWSRTNFSGRLVEISAAGPAAALTAAVGLVFQTQADGEPVAWITTLGSTFYPPDVADAGVDLASLAVVRAPDGRTAARAADRLIRSGAFGLIVLDLPNQARIATAQQGRLVSLAQKHDTAVVCVTAKAADTGSIGSMVSLRVEAQRLAGREPGRYRCRYTALKDKQRGPGWEHAEEVRGPAGLR